MIIIEQAERELKNQYTCISEQYMSKNHSTKDAKV